MNMKNTSAKLLAIIFLFTFAIVPLRAQTNEESSVTNTIVTNTVAPTKAAVENYGAHVLSSLHKNSLLSPATLAMLIPIVAIVMGCSIPIIVGSLSIYFRHRKNVMLHETVRTMVEKGVPIPPEMFNKTDRNLMDRDKSDDKHPRKDLRSGVLLTGIGIGVVMLCGKAGYIILFLGVAFVVIGMLNLGKGNNNDQPPKQ